MPNPYQPLPTDRPPTSTDVHGELDFDFSPLPEEAVDPLAPTIPGGRRAVAFTVDAVVMTSVVAMAGWLVILVGLPEIQLGFAVTAALAAQLFSFRGSGQTIGKRLLRLRVVTRDGRPASVLRGCVARTGLQLCILSVCGGLIGLVLILSGALDLTTHDRLLGTRVVPA